MPPTALVPDSVLIPALVLLGLGVPHGALDMLLWRRSGANTVRRFILAYLAVAAAVGWLFWLWPAAALTGFLLLSAAHFGEGDQHELGSGAPTPVAEAMFRGLLPVTLPFLAWPYTVSQLVGPLLPGFSERQCLVYVHLWGELAMLAVVGAGVWVVTNSPPAERWAHRRRAVLVELAAVVLCTSLLHPLLGFAIYFALLHSPRHILRVWRHIAQQWQPQRAAAILAATCVVTGLGTVVAGRFAAAHTPEEWWRVILILLASLTAPHAAVVWVALGPVGRGSGLRIRRLVGSTS